MGGFCSPITCACCHWQESSQLGPSWILLVLGPRDRASALSTSSHNWAAPEICFRGYLIMCPILLVDFEPREGRAMWDLSQDTDT